MLAHACDGDRALSCPRRFVCVFFFWGGGAGRQALTSPTGHETAVKVAGYILGEYGDIIANEPGSSPIEQFRALHAKFGACSLPTRALLLSTYIKFANLFPEIQGEIDAVFKQYADVLDVEVQQRACEYLAITHAPQTQLLEVVCDAMPAFQEKAESALVSLVKKKEGDTTDRRTVRAIERKRAGNKTNLTNFGDASSESVSPASAEPKAAPAPAAAVAAPPKSSTSALLDLLGLDDGPSAPTAAASAAPSRVAPPQASEVAPGSERALFKTVVALSGVLYEDGDLQIGVKSEYQGAKGRLGLYFGNKTGDAFAPFSVTVSPVGSGLSVSSQQSAPPVVAARTQAMEALVVSCDNEFAEPPLVAIVYGARRLVLRLPILPTRFCVPVQLQAADYFNRWKQIGAGDREAINDGHVAGGAAFNTASSRAILTGLNMSALDGVDPNPANLVGAAVFTTATDVKSGILVRVQVNPNDPSMIRVTARSTSPTVAAAVSTWLFKLLTA